MTEHEEFSKYRWWSTTTLPNLTLTSRFFVYARHARIRDGLWTVLANEYEIAHAEFMEPVYFVPHP